MNITYISILFLPVSVMAVELNMTKWEKLNLGKDGSVVVYKQELEREYSIVNNQIQYFDDGTTDFVMQIVEVVGKADKKRIYEITSYVKKNEVIPYAVTVSGDLVNGVVQINRKPYGKYKNETIVELGMLQQIPSLILELNKGVYEIRSEED
jgi:hypothetical protein